MEKQLARISELKQRILAIGYHPTQLNDIIREVVGTTSLATMTDEQNCELIKTLEDYYEFAQKCRKSTL